MVEFILGALVVVCATLIGNSFAQRLISRRKTLRLIIESVEKMKTYISFSSMEINLVVSQSFKGIKGFEPFCDCEQEAFDVMWEKCINSIGADSGLDKEDKTLLLRFSQGIGVSDVQGQMSHCDLYKKLFEERLQSATETANAKCRLYKMLGFSLGCAVTLMIV